MMNTILREFLDHRVVVYLDDIRIYSKSLKDHKALIKQVLAHINKNYYLRPVRPVHPTHLTPRT